MPRIAFSVIFINVEHVICILHFYISLHCICFGMLFCCCFNFFLIQKCGFLLGCSCGCIISLFVLNGFESHMSTFLCELCKRINIYDGVCASMCINGVECFYNACNFCAHFDSTS